MNAIGTSVPSASAVVAAMFRAALHPAGLSAPNALGLSTQNPGRGEFATPAAAGPGALRNAIVHTRRPPARNGVSAEQGALLEVLRDRARSSDLNPQRTIERSLRLARPGEFER
jgi:hypothetical protein